MDNGCNIDFEKLLYKYMLHVGYEEGTDFVDAVDYDKDLFTTGEKEQLKLISKQQSSGKENLQDFVRSEVWKKSVKNLMLEELKSLSIKHIENAI